MWTYGTGFMGMLGCMQVTGFICQRKGQGFWGQPTEVSFREARLEGGFGIFRTLGSRNRSLQDQASGN